MLTAELDHLVIATANLQQGEDYLASKLGVKPKPGGRHPRQGTHNSLLRLGESTYLEIISIDPDENKPAHPRWFDLDNPVLQKSIAREPRLISWVARTDNMEQALQQATYKPGLPQTARRGSLEWTFTFRKDGSLIEGGLLPALIEWKTPVHPSDNLPDSEIEITAFEASHPTPDVIKHYLASLNLEDVLKVKQANGSKIELEVTFDTPKGEVKLSSLYNNSLNG